MHHVLFLLICLIWGSNFLLMKKAGSLFGPISIGAYRVLGGAIVLGIVWAIRGRAWSLKKRHVAPFLFIVLVGYAWPFTIQPFLIARHGGSFIAMMVTLVPLLTIVLSVPMLGVRPTPRQLIGVVGGLVCIGIVFREGNLRLDVPLVDLALASTVPLAYCLANIVLKRRCADVGTLTLSFANLALAAAILLPIGWTVEGFSPGTSAVDNVAAADPLQEVVDAAATGSVLGEPSALVSVLCVIWLGTVGTGAANFMFYKLIQEHGPLFASMVTYLIPTIALFWGWVDDERITSLQIVGLAGTFIMIAIVQTSRTPKLEVGEELA